VSYALHNVAETLAQPDGGLRFQRVPETVRLTLNEHAQERMLDVTGTEIRFVMEGKQAEVHLHNLAGTGKAQVFFGDFRVNEVHTIGPELRTITVKRPDWFLSLDPQRLAPLAFARAYEAAGELTGAKSTAKWDQPPATK
jgi:hypothetical protein